MKRLSFRLTSRRTVLLTALLLAASGAHAARDIDKVNASIHARAGEAYDSLDTVNGDITIDGGVVVDSADTVNGAIRIGDQAEVDQAETVNGEIEVGQAVRLGSAETVNGEIRIQSGSSVSQSLETVNGEIHLSAVQVSGDLNTVNGDISVLDGSVVAGRILVEKPSGGWFNGNSNRRVPKIVIGAHSEVRGELRFEREVELFVHDSARIGAVVGAEPKRFSGNAP